MYLKMQRMTDQFPQMPTPAGLGQARPKTRIRNLIQVSPMRHWQWQEHLSHPQCRPGCEHQQEAGVGSRSQEPESGAEPGLKPRHSHAGTEIPGDF